MSSYIAWYLFKNYMLKEIFDYLYKNYKYIPVDMTITISKTLYKKYNHIPKEIIDYVYKTYCDQIIEEKEIEPKITILDKSKFND